MLSQRPTTPAICPLPPAPAASVLSFDLRPSPPAVLYLWHLLSLDAPTVALLWLVFVDTCAGVRADVCTSAALFVTVWGIYAGDRLLDAKVLRLFPFHTALAPEAFTTQAQSDLEPRHHFHHRHRRAFMALLVILTLILGALLWRLPAAILLPGVALAILLAAWLVQIHRAPASPRPRPLPKEFVVGLFFAAAVYMPAAVCVADRLSLLPGAALFAAVCTLNCLFLYAWEHPHDLSRAHPATGFAVRHVKLVAGVTVLAAGLAWLLTWTAPMAQIPLACALSASLLLALHTNRRRFSPLRLRALADLVLLTPLLHLALHFTGPWHRSLASP